jgi:hypothetical protein
MVEENSMFRNGIRIWFEKGSWIPGLLLLVIMWKNCQILSKVSCNVHHGFGQAILEKQFDFWLFSLIIVYSIPSGQAKNVLAFHLNNKAP